MAYIRSSSEIGWRLRTMRQKTGLSQERLAELIGVTSQQIQKYESGKSKLNADRLQQLAIVLSVPVQSFFTDNGDFLPLNVSEKLLIDSYRSIQNGDIRESILKIATHAAKVKE